MVSKKLKKSAEDLENADKEEAGRICPNEIVDDYCTNPLCDRELGCDDIRRRKADLKAVPKEKPWTIWPDGCDFDAAPTPELISQVKQTAPARDVIEAQRWNKVRVINNLKSSQLIVAESQLEFRLALHLFLDPDVYELGTQPETMTFPRGGSKVRYTPDFWVNRKGTLFYVEVKPEIKLAHHEVAEKLRLARLYLERRGIKFVVITERQIEDEIPLRNAELIYRFQTCPRDPAIIDRMRDFLADGPKAFQEIENVIGGAPARAHIMRALLANDLGYFPQFPITPQATIWWRKGAGQ